MCGVVPYNLFFHSTLSVCDPSTLLPQQQLILFHSSTIFPWRDIQQFVSPLFLMDSELLPGWVIAKITAVNTDTSSAQASGACVRAHWQACVPRCGRLQSQGSMSSPAHTASFLVSQIPHSRNESEMPFDSSARVHAISFDCILFLHPSSPQKAAGIQPGATEQGQIQSNLIQSSSRIILL